MSGAAEAAEAGSVDLVAGAGFLGAEVIRRLAARGRGVRGLARSAGEVAGGSGGGCVPVLACDLGDAGSVARVARELGRPVGLAVYCASTRGGDEADYRRVYLEGLRNVLRELRPARVVFVSSTSVYGQKDGGWVTEGSAADPGTEKGRILLEAEREALAAGGVVLRLAGLYGPGRSVHVEKTLAGRAVVEEGGERWINQIHRDDAAEAVVLAGLLEDAPRVMNVSDGTPMRQRELLGMIARHFGLPAPPEGPAGPRKRGESNKRVSSELLRSRGWRPRFGSFADFLASLPSGGAGV